MGAVCEYKRLLSFLLISMPASALLSEHSLVSWLQQEDWWVQIWCMSCPPAPPPSSGVRGKWLTMMMMRAVRTGAHHFTMRKDNGPGPPTARKNLFGHPIIAFKFYLVSPKKGETTLRKQQQKKQKLLQLKRQYISKKTTDGKTRRQMVMTIIIYTNTWSYLNDTK